MDQTVIMISQLIYLMNMYLPFVAALAALVIIMLFVVLWRLNRKLIRIERKLNQLIDKKGESGNGYNDQRSDEGNNSSS